VSNTDCANGFSCANGLCKKSTGQACSTSGECASGFCIDGVCCDNACSGLCMKCNQLGSVGTCANIPAGTDPDNECAGALNCNGAGACV